MTETSTLGFSHCKCDKGQKLFCLTDWYLFQWPWPTSLLNTIPWALPTSTVHFDLTTFKKEAIDSETYKQFYLKLVSEYPTFHWVFYDFSEREDLVAAAALCWQDYKKPDTCCLSNDSSVFTAELCATLIAPTPRYVYCLQGKSFLFLSDSHWNVKIIFSPDKIPS